MSLLACAFMLILQSEDVIAAKRAGRATPSITVESESRGHVAILKQLPDASGWTASFYTDQANSQPSETARFLLGEVHAPLILHTNTATVRLANSGTRLVIWDDDRRYPSLSLLSPTGTVFQANRESYPFRNAAKQLAKEVVFLEPELPYVGVWGPTSNSWMLINTDSGSLIKPSPDLVETITPVFRRRLWEALDSFATSPEGLPLAREAGLVLDSRDYAKTRIDPLLALAFLRPFGPTGDLPHFRTFETNTSFQIGIRRDRDSSKNDLRFAVYSSCRLMFWQAHAERVRDYVRLRSTETPMRFGDVSLEVPVPRLSKADSLEVGVLGEESGSRTFAAHALLFASELSGLSAGRTNITKWCVFGLMPGAADIQLTLKVLKSGAKKTHSIRANWRVNILSGQRIDGGPPLTIWSP